MKDDTINWNKSIEKTLIEILKSRARSRIYIFLLRKKGAILPLFKVNSPKLRAFDLTKNLIKSSLYVSIKTPPLFLKIVETNPFNIFLLNNFPVLHNNLSFDNSHHRNSFQIPSIKRRVPSF